MGRVFESAAVLEHQTLYCKLREEVSDLVIEYRIAWARWAVTKTQSLRLRTYRYYNDGHDPFESCSKSWEALDLNQVWIDPQKEWVDPVVDFINAVYELPNSWFREQNIPLDTRGRLIVKIATNPRYKPSPKDEPLATHVRMMEKAVGIRDDHFEDCRDASELPPREEREFRVQLLCDALNIEPKFFSGHTGSQAWRNIGCPLNLREKMVFDDKTWMERLSALPAKIDFFQDNEGFRRLCWLLTEPDFASEEMIWLRELYRPVMRGQFGMEPEELARLYDRDKQYRYSKPIA